MMLSVMQFQAGGQSKQRTEVPSSLYIFLQTLTHSTTNSSDFVTEK